MNVQKSESSPSQSQAAVHVLTAVGSLNHGYLRWSVEMSFYRSGRFGVSDVREAFLQPRSDGSGRALRAAQPAGGAGAGWLGVARDCRDGATPARQRVSFGRQRIQFQASASVAKTARRRSFGFEAYGVRAPVFLSRSCLPGVMPDSRSSRARSAP